MSDEEKTPPQTSGRREEATWWCPVCGEIAPRQYGRLYVRATCACERAQAKQRYERAWRRHRQTVVPAVPATKMRRVGELPLLPLPERVFARMGGVESEEQAWQTCPRCGAVPPTRYANGYVPGTCACRREEMQERRRAVEQESARQAHAEARRKACRLCYQWLGEWSEPELSQATFDAFDIDLQPEGFLAAYRFAETVKAREEDPELPPAGTLVLWSDSSWGTGKTHLGAAICNALLEANIPCLFTTGQNLFHAFGARFDEGQGVGDLIARAGDTPLLVVDDLDKTHMTASGYKSSVFFSILNRRYLKRLPTVITTNATVHVSEHDIGGLSQYLGQASCSRLKEYGLAVVRMEGADYRHRLGAYQHEQPTPDG